MSAQRRRSSVASLDNEHLSVPRVGSLRSLRSFSSSASSILSIDGLPPLPLVVSVRECLLRRRSSDAVGPGWGFVLRGTTSEFPERTKIYTCHIESVHDDGTAKVGVHSPMRAWLQNAESSWLYLSLLESLHGKPLI